MQEDGEASAQNEGWLDRLRANRLIGALFAGGLLGGVRVITGLIRVKYMALTLGVTGIGLISQGNQIFLVAVALCSLSMAVGLIHRLNQTTSDEQKRRLLSTTFTVQAGISLVVITLSFPFADTLSIWLMGEDAHPMYFIAVIFSVPFQVMASSYFEGVFFGHHRYDLYIRASVWSTITGLLVFLPAVGFYGLKGAFAAITAGAFLCFAWFLWYGVRILPLRDLLQPGFDRSEFSALLRFSATMLSTSLMTYGSLLLIRQQVIQKLGVEENGILQVPIALTSYYTPFLANGLWGHFHPTVSRQGPGEASATELIRTLGTIALFATLAVFALTLFQEWVVQLAWSRDFLPATSLLPVWFAGDLFYFITFVFSIYFLGLGQVKTYVTGYLLYFLGICVVTFAGINHYGIAAYPYAYTATNLVFCLGLLLWLLARCGQAAAGAALIILGCGLLVGLHTGLMLGLPEQPLWRGLAPALLGLCLVFRMVRQHRTPGPDQSDGNPRPGNRRAG